MNLYFICTGNTCRSPMAEAIMRAKNLEGVQVRSAGIQGVDGIPISEHAKTLIEKNDMPYTDTSRAVTQENVDWAHVILTMTGTHREVLCNFFPEAQEKIHTLKGFIGQRRVEDVQDPFGGSLDMYKKTFLELVDLLEQLEEKMTKG